MFNVSSPDRRLDEDRLQSANTRHGWSGAGEHVYTESLQDEDDRYLSVDRVLPRRLLARRCRTLLEKLAQALTRRLH